MGVSVTTTKQGFETINSFKIEGVDEEIFVLSDPPHLLKNMRNALFNNGEFTIHDKYVNELEEELQMQLPSNKVKFEHIKRLVEFQEERQLKICPHLSHCDIDIGKYGKMKVKYAKHVLSRETAAALKLAVEKYPDEFPVEALTTSIFCEKVGKYYDHMTCRGVGLAFSNLHPEKLQQAFDYMEWFVGFYTSISIGKKHRGGQSLKPTQRGIIMATTSMIDLAKFMLKQEGVKFLRPGMVSNDPIENFHGSVRSRNKKPTCLNFMRITKAICMCQCLDGPANGSYDQDDVSDSIFTDIKALKEAKEHLDWEKVQQENEAALGDVAAKEDLEFTNLMVDGDDDISEICALSYLTGYLLRKTICTQSKCEKCKTAFVADEHDEQMTNELIRLRDYKKGALCRPTEIGNKMFQVAEKVFRHLQEKLIYQKKSRLGDKIASAIILQWKENFPQVPSCHFKTMANRFSKIRLLFYGAYSSHQLELAQKEKLVGASHASQCTVPIHAPNMK